jgi:hypothetical protein
VMRVSLQPQLRLPCHWPRRRCGIRRSAVTQSRRCVAVARSCRAAAGSTPPARSFDKKAVISSRDVSRKHRVSPLPQRHRNLLEGC